MKNRLLLITLTCLSLSSFGSNQAGKQAFGLLKILSNARQAVGRTTAQAVEATTLKATPHHLPAPKTMRLHGWTPPTHNPLQAFPLPKQASFQNFTHTTTTLKAGVAASPRITLSAQELEALWNTPRTSAAPSLIPFAPETFEGFGIGSEESPTASAPTHSADQADSTIEIKKDDAHPDQGAFFTDPADEEQEDAPLAPSEPVKQEADSLLQDDSDVILFAQPVDVEITEPLEKPTTILFKESSARESSEAHAFAESSASNTGAEILPPAATISEPQPVVDNALVLVDTAHELAAPSLSDSPSVEKLQEKDTRGPSVVADLIDYFNSLTVKKQTTALVASAQLSNVPVVQPQSDSSTALAPFIEQPSALLPVSPEQPHELVVIDQHPHSTAHVQKESSSTLKQVIATSGAVALSAGTAAVITARTKKSNTTQQLLRLAQQQAPALKKSAVSTVQQGTKKLTVPTPRQSELMATKIFKTARKNEKEMIKHFKEESAFRADMAKFHANQTKATLKNTTRVPKAKNSTKTTTPSSFNPRPPVKEDAHNTARIKTETELKQTKETRLQQEKEAHEKADAQAREDARIKAEAEAKEKSEHEQLERDRAEAEKLKQAEEIKLQEKAEAQAKEDARLKAEKEEADAHKKAEHERLEQERIKAEELKQAEETKLREEKIKEDARLKEEKEAQEKAEAQAKEKSEQEKREQDRAEADRIEQERIKTEEARLRELEKAKEEAYLKTEAELKKTEEARLKAEAEAKAKEDARLKEEKEAAAREKAKQELLEQERVKAEKLKQAEDIKLQEEAEAQAKKDARLKAEKEQAEAQQKAEHERLEQEKLEQEKLEQERIKAEELKQAEETKLREEKIKEDARIKAEAEAKEKSEHEQREHDRAEAEKLKQAEETKLREEEKLFAEDPLTEPRPTKKGKIKTARIEQKKKESLDTSKSQKIKAQKARDAQRKAKADGLRPDIEMQAKEEAQKIRLKAKEDAQRLEHEKIEAEKSRLQEAEEAKIREQELAEAQLKKEARLKTEKKAHEKAKANALKVKTQSKRTVKKDGKNSTKKQLSQHLLPKTKTTKPSLKNKPTFKSGHSKKTQKTKQSTKKRNSSSKSKPKGRKKINVRAFGALPHFVTHATTNAQQKMKSFLPKVKKKKAAEPAKEEPKKENPPAEETKDETKKSSLPEKDTEETTKSKKKRKEAEEEEFDEDDDNPLMKKIKRTKPAKAKPEEVEEEIADDLSLPAASPTAAKKALAPVVRDSLAAARNAWASKINVEPASPFEMYVPTTEELNAKAARQRIIELPLGKKDHGLPLKATPPAHHLHPESNLPLPESVTPKVMPHVSARVASVPALEEAAAAQYPEHPLADLAMKKESTTKIALDFGKELINRIVIKPLKQLTHYAVEAFTTWIK